MGEAERACFLTFLDFIVLSSVTLFLQAKIFVCLQSYFSLPSPFLPLSLSTPPPFLVPLKEIQITLLLIGDYKSKINLPLPSSINISLFSIHTGENKQN